MPARAAYRLSRTSMYWRDHGNNSVSGLALASSSSGDSAKSGSLSIRRACSVGRLFFSRLTDTLPSQMSRPRIASVSDTRSPCRRPTSKSDVVQRIVLPGDLEQSDQFVAIEVFHKPPCQSVQCNYRHIYGTIVIYSNLWSMLLTGICLEVTLGS